MNFKYLFIGAGAANVYATLYLLENGVPGHNICMIDKGLSINERTKDDLIHGMLGAGAFSDSKHIFSHQEDLNIIDYLGIDKVEDYYTFIKSQILKFHPDPSTISITEPTDFTSKTTEGWGNVSIAQSLTWHVGSEWGVRLIKEIEKYISDQGVRFMFNTKVTGVDVQNKEVCVDLKLPYILSYDNLIVATGRAGSKFVNNILDHNNIELKKNYLDIGCRFEIEYTDKVKEIADLQYDFKFKVKVNEGDHNESDARSFCVCHYSSYVAEEIKEGQFLGWNGEGYGLHAHDKANGLTNFGILINLRDIDADNIMANARFNKCIVLGDDYNFKSSTEDNYIASKEMLKELPAGKEILEFIEKIKPILGFGENYKIHYPEIKEGSGKLLSSKPWQVDGLEDVYFVGDSSFSMKDGGSRGIVPAAVTGIDAIKAILDKTSLRLP